MFVMFQIDNTTLQITTFRNLRAMHMRMHAYFLHVVSNMWQINNFISRNFEL